MNPSWYVIVFRNMGTKLFFFLLTVALTGHFSPFMLMNAHADSIEALQRALPDQVRGWTAEPQDRFFDKDTIFDYIDGAGEVYRAYNMRRCLSRRYNSPKGPPIVVDIFDMGSSRDAFGVFTHDQDGERVELGQGALYRSGWLNFWKDRFFISIFMEEETADAKKAVWDLGRLLASFIPARGAEPKILLQLPLEGLQPRSVRYLHDHNLLNYHFYLSDENILGLGPQTDVALAEYQRQGETAILLLVMYPNPENAAKGLAALRRHYLPEAKSTGPVLLENKKWSAAAAKDKWLAVVFDAHGKQLAERLLKEAVER
jgi:hypothetical protein